MKSNLAHPVIRANCIADAAKEAEWRRSGPDGPYLKVGIWAYLEAFKEITHDPDPRSVLEILGIKDNPVL